MELPTEAMERSDAAILVSTLTDRTPDNFGYVSRRNAKDALGEARYAAMMADKIRCQGPSSCDGVYPWNVIDYLSFHADQVVVSKEPTDA